MQDSGILYSEMLEELLHKLEEAVDSNDWELVKEVIYVIRENLDTPTTVAIKNNTAWVLEAQFGHLFGEDKNIPPDKFKIIGVKLETSLLTSLKNLLNIFQ